MSAAVVISDLLEHSGMSKKALCDAAGISRSSLDAYLKGEREPSFAQVERLGAAAGLKVDISWTPVELQLDPSWLIPDNDDMSDPPTTTAERAALLERVIPLGRAMARRPRPPEMEFPPFKTLVQQ